MADRPFPPSPRRRALARQAGLHAASPLLTAAAAGAAFLAVAGTVAASLAHRLRTSLAAACAGRAADAPGAPGLVHAIVDAVQASAVPVAAAAAVAAIALHVVQTGTVWLPRRRIAGAPAVDTGPAPRTGRGAFDLLAAAAIGGVALGWLWLDAPQLAAVLMLDPTDSEEAALMVRGGAGLLADLVAALVIAWAALGVIDALIRRAALAGALAMTRAEKRDDDRATAIDPRWRAHRAAHRDPDPSGAIAGASVLLLGDSAAVAVAWDALRRPIPVRTITGRDLRARQLLGLARRHRIAVHRDAALTAALVDGDGPVPDAHWARLAEVIAAVRGRG